MKIKIFMIMLAIGAAPCFAGPDAVKIMSGSDRIMNPDQPYTVSVELTDFRAGVAVSTLNLQAYAFRDRYTRRMTTLVDFLSPEKDDGKLMLKQGRNLWLYTPLSSGTVHISPRQQLLGTASNSDVLAVNLALDYKPAYEGRARAKDSAGTVRDCVNLNLRARDDNADYLGIQYWVEEETNLPVQAKYYSDSGRLLKTVFYGKYRSELGSFRPTELLVVDGVDSRYVTRISFSGYRYKNIGLDWFEPSALHKFARAAIAGLDLPAVSPLSGGEDLEPQVSSAIAAGN
ncbi:MAG: outer membrane lipoprotein-sorting protein [Elusimicrobiaceae bacterium]|nr:outer membrane lipoprotein-sorting protein [Elusimicrobiaceae bacterium]